jgi:hypothetical protein
MGLATSMLWARPPATAGAYVASLAVLTAGYALFQAANNTAVMAGAAAQRRGLVSGLLGLSRNLGLVSGAAAMGAVFMHGAGASTAPAAIVSGFRACFGLAALLMGLAMLAAALLLRRSPTSAPDTLPQ